MIGIGIGLGILGAARSPFLFHAAFDTPGATTMPSGMTFARASVGRVRTGDATRASLTTDQPGIGLSVQGYAGLVHEASTTFLFKNSAVPGGTSWNTTAHGAVASDGPAPPEGGAGTTQHLSDVSLGDSTYQQVALAASSQYTIQAWLRPHDASAGSTTQFAVASTSFGDGTAMPFSGWLGDDEWRHFFGTVTTTTAATGTFKFSSSDWQSLATGPDNGFFSPMQNIDAAEITLEKKPYPTSMITSPSAATVTRAASFGSFDSADAILDGGRLSLHLRIVPHGKHADYTADFYLWFVDADNCAKVTASTRILTVTIGGTLVYTADTAVDWWQGRPLDVWLAVGGAAATKLAWQKWDGGWTFATDGDAVDALSLGAVPLYVLSSDADSTHFDCVVQSVAAYRASHDPATNTTVLDGVNLVCDGNSLTFGTGAASTLGKWAEQAKRALGEGVTVDYSSAVFGQTTGDMLADYDTDIAPKYSATARRNILVAWEITNDLLGYLNDNGITAADADVSAAVTYVTGRFQTYCEGAQATGWSVVAVDVIARGHTASGAGSNVPDSFEPARLLVNAWLLANWTTFAGAFVVLGNHPKIGDPTIMANGSLIWSSDGVHCTNLGDDDVARGIVERVRTLLA